METSTVSRAVKIGLHACGVWPYLPSTVFYRLFWILMLSAPQILQYQYLAIHYQGDDFSDFMDGVSSAMAYSLLFIKLTILWVNQRTFSDILQMMALDWKNCVLTDHSLRITTNKAKLSRRFSNWIIGLQLTAIVLYSCGVLAVNAGEIPRMNVSAREHILKMKLPFKVNTSPIYVAVTILQFFHLVMCGCGISIVNSLIVTLSIGTPDGPPILVRSALFYVVMNLETFIYCFAGEYLSAKSKMIGDAAYDSFWYDVTLKKNRIVLLVILRSQKRLSITIGKIMDLSLERFTSILHVGGQIDILRRWLMEIFSKERKHPSLSTIKRIIRKHQRIIIFSGYIEDLYSSVAMVVFVSDTLIICCLAFILVTSKSIGDAAYNSLWYEADSKDIWIILFLIMRSQTEITITIGKVMNLSLERFTGLLRASASYVSVLLAMN
nr:PREDICTED: uncharacterized protein LOC105670797 [Linepithema humile]